MPVCAIAWSAGWRWGIGSVGAISVINLVLIEIFLGLSTTPVAPFLVGHGAYFFLAGGIGFLHETIAALKHSRELLRASADCQLLCRASDGVILEANRAALTALACDEGDVVGKLRLGELAPFIDLSAVPRDGTPTSHRGWFQRSDGMSMPVSVSISFLEAQGVETMVVYSRNIQSEIELDERRLEAERRQIAADAEAQLLRANRLAQIGTMAAGIAHEVNNPLTFIVGSHGLIRDDLLPRLADRLGSTDEDHELLSELEQAIADAALGGERIQRITDELKLFARTPEAAWAKVDVGRVVRVALRMARHHLGPRAELAVDIDDGCVAAIDESKLSQVVINLLTNAAHAISEEAEPRVDLRVRRGPGEVVIEVEDTGTGIPEDRLEQIFGAFYTTKPVGQGTGLGLSVCLSIVNDMGGSLTAESEVGVGSTFRVRLPTADPTEVEAPSIQEEAAEAGEGSLAILIVDDEPVLRRLLRRMLSGHEVHEAESSEHALALMGTRHWDVVICDLMMPEQSGMDVYREVERDDPALAARFLFISGGAVTSEADSFSKINRDRLLSKPVSPSELRAAVQAAAAAIGEHRPTCPQLSSCPVFPVLEDRNLLAVYSRHFCGSRDGGYESCARYQSFHVNKSPPPRWLLPDGGRLE